MSNLNSFSTSNLSSILINGVKRTFKVRKILINNLEVKNEKFPLIIAFHGFSGNSSTIESISRLTNLSEDENFYLVYPNGYSKNTNSLFYSWNTGFCCGNAYENDSEDVEFIRKLIYFLLDTYPIDKDKILLTGISNGAMMVHRLGAELGLLIAGIIPIAGSIGGWQNENSELKTISDPISPMNVLIIHGTADKHVPFNGGLSKGSMYKILSVEDTINFWIQANNCSPFAEKTTLKNEKVIKDVYLGGINDTEVIVYTIIDGTHLWPGGNKGLNPENQTSNFDALKVIWEYLSSI